MDYKYLYIDNFRGFSKATLPLKQINFFVGENSTGKSSILKMIKIMEDLQGFWLSPQPKFKSGDADLGSFKDMVSVKSKDKRYFRIGSFKCSESNGKIRYSAFLLTFIPKDGMPAVKRYTVMDEEKQIDFRFSENKVWYKRQEFNKPNGYQTEEVKQFFMTWSKMHDMGIYNYTQFPKKFVWTSLGVLDSLLSLDFQKDEDFLKRFSISGWFKFFSGESTWIAPIRSKPKITYDLFNVDYSSEGEHTPYAIKSYFGKKSTRGDFISFLTKFGRNSGLFDDISIRNFGRGVTSPFELDITVNGNKFNITNVGYGVSQVLPIVVELFKSIKGNCFIIQQPEIHLHPKAQAALGDLFFNLASTKKTAFIIETHSDFIIDRFRMGYRNNTTAKEGSSSQIVFFEHTGDGNIFHAIDILPDGKLPEEQPKSYRDFFLNEDLRVLGY